MAIYGGSLSATAPGGVAAENLNQTGNCLMLFVMFTMCWWLWPTYKCTMVLDRKHPMFRPAKLQMMCAVSMILGEAREVR